MTTLGRHKQSSNARSAAVIALVGMFVIGSCTSGRSSTPSTTTVPGSTTTTAPDDTAPGRAVLAKGVRLSKGQAITTTAQAVPVVDGTPLDDAAIRAVIDRLPEWTLADTLAQSFNWPTQTRPAPRAGTTIDLPFPALEQLPPAEVPTGPLHVLRVQPDGDISIAPFVTITFDQPMVPIATVGQLDSAVVPATISPAVPGHWQWIGTKTLRFDGTSDLDRLPMATDYTVTVPAGTTSATGGVLADEVSFQFSTPPATAQSLQPTGSSLPLSPVFVATFDQQIVAEAVLATVQVRAGDDGRAVRLATPAEVDADDVAREAVANSADGRWIAFTPVEPLPADAPLAIDIGPGTPSAEGPRTTSDSASFTGHTFEPLEVVAVECGYGPACPPTTDINISFNNPLDLEAFDPSTIAIDPAIPGAVVGVYGNVVVIRGATQAQTTYRITVPAALTDVHGQQLGRDDTRSVDIGDAAPVLEQFTQPLTTLDPLAPKPTVSVRTVNHHDFRVRMFQVGPQDWAGYMQFLMDMQSGTPTQVDPPWSVVDDQTIAVDGEGAQAAETPVDLSGALGGEHGHVVVLVEPTEVYNVNDPNYWMNRPTMTWVQATSIGIDALTDLVSLHAWTTDLRTGAPLPGVAVDFVGASGSAVTDDDGLATIALGAQPTTAITATIGDDTAILAAGYFGSWQRSTIDDEARWYVFDDRQTYRPGETVSIKGWVRRLTSSSDAQLQLVGENARVGYAANDSQGNVIATGHAVLNPLGGFDLTFDIPADANLGYTSVQFTLEGVSALPFAGYGHSLQIEEFRRPEFEVSAHNESVGPYLRGAPITVGVDADYYAGGPLAAAPVSWQVTTSGAQYSPPGWDEFSFGRWTPWWFEDAGFGRGVVDACCFPPSQGEADVKSFSGTTDDGGSNFLQIDVGNLDPSLDGLPVTVQADAAVTDINRQTWASTTSVLVHPASLYVGLRSPHSYVRRGDPLTVDAIVTDVDGKVVGGRSVRVTASRTETVFRDGEWVESPVDTQTCELTSAAEPTTCTFTTSTGGTYEITAIVVDDAGRSSRSELTRWVSGEITPPTRNVEQQSLTLVPDKAEYQPGDSVQLLVQSPFADGDGLLTVSRVGIVSTTRFAVVDGSAVVQIPITDGDLPNIDVSIEVVGATQRAADDGTPLEDAPLRPAFATGRITLPISTESRKLTVRAVPRADAVAPGSTTQVDVDVVDSDGNPVAGSELAVVVVDEAVLALSRYTLQDPLAAFYSHLPSYLGEQYGRQSIVLTNPAGLGAGGGTDDAASTATTIEAAAAPQASVPDGAKRSADSTAGGAANEMAPGASNANGSPIDVRTNFDALAVFAPSVTTDAGGRATIDVPLPDNLTRYRVMVVAVSGVEQFGAVEANITARLPLMVRPSAPRFLNFGDTFQLPVLLQNQTDTDMQVDVVVQTDNLTLTGAAGLHVSVPANDRVEVRFPAAAAHVGTARFRVAAVSGDAADAATIELPVYTPATAEAFATYGVIDDGAIVQPTAAPTDVVPEFGGLDVTTSSTSLQALTDAVIYLSDYPYKTSDAIASQILAIASLRDVLDAFDAPGLPSAIELDKAVTDGIERLVTLQNDDGGFPYWQHGRPSDPFNSVEATHALLVARDGGFAVPQATIDRALTFIGEIEQHIPAEYGQDARDSISAYALSVRMLAGDRDTTKANALFDSRREGLPLDAIAWLWPVVDDGRSAAIERIIDNKAVDTAGAVTFTTEANDDDYVTLRSDRRTDGLVLDALIAERPASDLIPKVVAGLLAGQKQGRWDNVQENSFILLALKHYFDAFESQTPEFVARVWLGDRFAGEHDFAGRSTDRIRMTIPTADLIAGGDSGITIEKEGTGRLYYRIGLRTAPSDLTLEPLDRGFVVARTYERVDDPTDVTRDADGTWHIKAGARVRVRLTMVAESQRTHVALIDQLPAGMEILNPELAVTEEIPVDPEQPSVGDGDFRSWWYPTWFDHQNNRDDRAEAFATYLGAGSYDYSYVARATTPGSFVVPPARAEEMYAPETFGRGATDAVVVDG